MSELNDEILDVVEDGDYGDVTEDDIRDSLVITIPIDSTLAVSGAAADARATGQAIAAKASEADVKNQLSVNGRTGNGGWAIMVNGVNIPAQNDDDTESVAEALERIDAAVSTEATSRTAADTTLGERIDTLTTRIGTEETARAAADTALGTRIDGAVGRLDALEAKQGLLVRIDFTAAGQTTITDTRFTADHVLTGVSWLDSLGAATGDVLADLTWTTAAGSLVVDITTVYAAGSVILNFGYRADATPVAETGEEVTP